MAREQSNRGPLTLLAASLLAAFCTPAVVAAPQGEGARLAEPCIYTDDEGRTRITNDPSDPNCRDLLPEDPGATADGWRPRHPDVLDLRTLEVVSLAHRVAVREGVDHRLVEALIEVESGYDPRAVSSKGALGLMQVMPEVLESYGVTEPFDVQQNVEAGVRHLRSLIVQFRMNLRLALAAYNAGVQPVLEYAGMPPYPETREFVRRVVEAYRQRIEGPGFH